MLDGSLSASPKALSWLRAPTPPWPSGLVLPTAFQEHGSDHAPEPQGERGSCYREEDNNHSLKMWKEATTKSTKSRADGGDTKNGRVLREHRTGLLNHRVIASEVPEAHRSIGQKKKKKKNTQQVGNLQNSSPLMTIIKAS